MRYKDEYRRQWKREGEALTKFICCDKQANASERKIGHLLVNAHEVKADEEGVIALD